MKKVTDSADATDLSYAEARAMIIDNAPLAYFGAAANAKGWIPLVQGKSKTNEEIAKLCAISSSHK
ncbi:hypothetical protein [Spirochaeta dissipatitropha]